MCESQTLLKFRSPVLIGARLLWSMQLTKLSLRSSLRTVMAMKLALVVGVGRVLNLH